MPRRIDPKCLACAQLDANAAIELHGPDGDDCWDSSRCPRRRSHYRNRRENNAKRRAQERASRRALLAEENGTTALAGTDALETKLPEVVVIEPDTVPVAYLYLYREKRKDAPLHAVAISVWQGQQKLIEIAPIHCAGLKNRQVQSYLQKALNYLTARYGIRKFEPEVRLEPAECPIAECPLNEGRLSFGYLRERC